MFLKKLVTMATMVLPKTSNVGTIMVESATGRERTVSTPTGYVESIAIQGSSVNGVETIPLSTQSVDADGSADVDLIVNNPQGEVVVALREALLRHHERRGTKLPEHSIALSICIHVDGFQRSGQWRLRLPDGIEHPLTSKGFVHERAVVQAVLKTAAGSGAVTSGPLAKLAAFRARARVTRAVRKYLRRNRAAVNLQLAALWIGLKESLAAANGEDFPPELERFIAALETAARTAQKARRLAPAPVPSIVVFRRLATPRPAKPEQHPAKRRNTELYVPSGGATPPEILERKRLETEQAVQAELRGKRLLAVRLKRMRNARISALAPQLLSVLKHASPSLVEKLNRVIAKGACHHRLALTVEEEIESCYPGHLPKQATMEMRERVKNAQAQSRHSAVCLDYRPIFPEGFQPGEDNATKIIRALCGEPLLASPWSTDVAFEEARFLLAAHRVSTAGHWPLMGLLEPYLMANSPIDRNLQCFRPWLLPSRFRAGQIVKGILGYAKSTGGTSKTHITRAAVDQALVLLGFDPSEYRL